MMDLQRPRLFSVRCEDEDMQVGLYAAFQP